MLTSTEQPRKISNTGLNIVLGVCTFTSITLMVLSTIVGMSCFIGIKIPSLPEYSPLHFFVLFGGIALSAGLIILSTLAKNTNKLIDTKMNELNSNVKINSPFTQNEQITQE